MFPSIPANPDLKENPEAGLALEKGYPAWVAPLVLLFVCAVAFGLMLPRLGFYWDDWAKLLVSRLFGLSGYWAYYAEDRPLSGWTHILFTPILDGRPIAWQCFDLGLRWLSGLGLWWCLTLIWPRQRNQALYAAILFVIYPVFTQQAVSITFHQQWLQYVLYFLSVGMMLAAASGRRGYWLLTFFSLASMVAELTVTEYFVGLEALRVLLLWFLAIRMAATIRKRLLWLLKYSWPYILLLGIYVIWRLFFIKLTGADPYKAEMLFNLVNQPVSTLQALVRMISADTLYVLFGSWGQVVSLGLDHPNPLGFVVFAWAAALFTAIILLFLVLRLEKEANITEESRWGWPLQALLVGFAATMLGCLPGWITNRPVIFDFHSNRYAQPAMFGAALVWATALDWLVQRRMQKAVVLSSLAGILVLFSLYTAGDYAQIWSDQLDFYWQLYWRAPALQQDTAIMAENELFPNQGSFSTSAAINLLYPQDRGRNHLAFWFYNLQPRFAIDPADSPLGIPLKTQFRTLTYEGKTGESLIIFYDPQRANCLWILGKDDALSADLPVLTRKMLPASDLNRIQAEPLNNSYPVEEIFGKEPPRSWCYFYEKAALAVQFGDWVKAAALADEARANPENTPKNPWFKTPHEWIPFVEAYGHVGRWREAQEIAIQAANVYQARNRDEFCGMWQRLLQNTPESQDRQAATDVLQNGLNCGK